jgi:hypothetical protein
MDFKKHLENAWNAMLKNLVPLLLMTLVMSVLSVVTFGILAPVMLAGYYQSILLMLRSGRTPSINDLFSEMRLFLPLLVFSLVVFFATMLGFMLLVVPGIAVVCLLAFACLYMLPLMTDKKMGMMDAIKKSWEMATQGNMADHIVVVILYIGLIAIGSSVFIGILFTQPFATIFILSVFEERMAGGLGKPVAPPPPPVMNGNI